MEIHHWINDHGFDLLESVGIIASLVFSTIALFRDDRSRRVENFLTLISSHRDIWKETIREPALKRLFLSEVDLDQTPITAEEEVFVTIVFQQINATFYAMQNGLTINLEGLRQDIRQFFANPIPRDVWIRLKPLQNRLFAAFVDDCLR
jgi:hypothetical protein